MRYRIFGSDRTEYLGQKLTGCDRKHKNRIAKYSGIPSFRISKGNENWFKNSSSS